MPSKPRHHLVASVKHMGHVDEIASTAFFLARNESGSVSSEGTYEKYSLPISEREVARMRIA